MAGWKLKRGNPEWHEVMLYRDTLRDGTVIEAYTEDCDGDMENWGVRENGVEVASGTFPGNSYEKARESAERVICYGVPPSPLPATTHNGEGE